ncbi:hypothetical protein SAMN05443287_12017 [Micromonospora phaseoli]|uniref:Competence protein J (ComJ) n=1 Tax=Micromonospora phaseoli TaxID=1144548 RepID=A0A1H7DWC3_9ACTN|nr:hypothetical protein [Micromonospora phaseoli]PZV88785.1 hypothetical protein CLV64_1189 [Micromonospora phaseoli]GIJ81268.1 hypothetical protein Xph01_57000 [Micromonospora phaseoli]SEK06079.1 hypothetical protein SAMN05443287_12017 [Micromonospora phaseoli]
MADDREVVRRLEPYADHLAFVISDAEATEDFFDGDTWDRAEDTWRIAVERHCIVVGTARYDHVPVTVALMNTPPEVESLDAFDHVVEADILLPSGRMAVTGATELPNEGEPVPLPAGRYRVRVVYAQTDRRPVRCDLDGVGDHLEYQLTMWPTDADLGVHVLKQGPSPWAY